MQFAFKMVILVQEFIVQYLSPGVSVRSKIHCVSLCSVNASCSSVFYELTYGKCHLQDTEYEIGDLNISAPGYQYLINKCVPGYTRIRSLNLCYKLHTKKKTWQDARRVCEQDGAYLLKVDSDEMHDFVGHVANVTGSSIFIGGTDEVDEDKWLWPDGSTVLPKFWAPNQPNNQDEQDYMFYSYVETDRYKLHDGGADGKKIFLCQQK